MEKVVFQPIIKPLTVAGTLKGYRGNQFIAIIGAQYAGTPLPGADNVGVDLLSPWSPPILPT